MKTALLICSTVAALLLSPPSLNWTPFISREGGFVVTMPDTPREQTKTLNTVHGPIQMHMFIARPAGTPDEFLVVYQELSPGVAARPAAITLAGACRGAIRGTHGQLLGSRDITLQGYPAREFQVRTGTGGLFLSRAIVARGRMYQVDIATTNSTGDLPGAERFFNSFKLLPRR